MGRGEADRGGNQCTINALNCTANLLGPQAVAAAFPHEISASSSKEISYHSRHFPLLAGRNFFCPSLSITSLFVTMLTLTEFWRKTLNANMLPVFQQKGNRCTITNNEHPESRKGFSFQDSIPSFLPAHCLIFVALPFAKAFVFHHKCQRVPQLLGLACDRFSFYSKMSMRLASAVFWKIYNEVPWYQYPKATTFRQNILKESCRQKSQLSIMHPPAPSEMTHRHPDTGAYTAPSITVTHFAPTAPNPVLTSWGLSSRSYTEFCCWITAVNAFLERSLAS